jgi:kynurenine formamidase
MTRHIRAGAGLLAATVVLGFAWSATLTSQVPPPADIPRMTAEEFEKMFEANRNWGRWGKDDRLGALNLITDAKRRQAAALVKNGVSVSLAHDLSTEAAPDNPNPLKLNMGANFRTDTLDINYHGTFVTHFDALCHFPYKNMLYNGVPLKESNEKGCAIGVQHFKNGIVTRGVLIDIPRLKGIPYMEPPAAVYPSDVEAWEKKTGIKISSGDAVILHTGRWVRRAKLGPYRVLQNAAGFHASIIPWFRQRDVALVAGDTTPDIQSEPRLIPGEEGRMPLHTAMLAGLGVPLIDDIDADKLAETAAKLNRWEFMLVIAPLAIPGGTGGPVNPIAIF